MKRIQLHKVIFLFACTFALFTSCIQDDFIEDRVDPVVRITTQVESIEVNTSFQFEFNYLNEIGQQEEVEAIWRSADENIISIDETGLATALLPGQTTIHVTVQTDEMTVEDEILVEVGESTMIVEAEDFSGTIETTTFYTLEGSFDLVNVDGGLELNIMEDYRASSSLPGLYLYMSNNENSIANALEIGRVTVFNGAHNYSIPGVTIDEYKFLVYFCKPFNVKVGEAKLTE